MKPRRKIVHVVSVSQHMWDLLEKKWDIHPKIIGVSCRVLHSARRARKDFNEFRKHKWKCMRDVCWLTYVNGKLVKSRLVGYHSKTNPHSVTINVDHECLNSAGNWWKIIRQEMSKSTSN